MSHHGFGLCMWSFRLVVLGAVALSFSTALPAQVLESVEIHRSFIVNNPAILLDPNGVSLIALRNDTVLDHGGAVVVFSRNTSNGDLSLMEMQRQGYSGVEGITDPLSGVLSPDGSHLYVGGIWGETMAIFDRDPLTGHLEYSDHLSATSTFNYIVDLAMSRDGEVVYALSKYDEVITVFARDQADGSLTHVQDFSTHPVGFANPATIELSPDGAHLYTGVGPKLGILDVDGVTGTLSYLDTLVPLIDPTALALSPDGNHLYIGSGTDDGLAVYERNPANGALTFVELLEHGVGGITSLNAVASVKVIPDGSQVVVSAGNYTGFVTVFDRDAGTGRLSVSAVHENGVDGIRGLAEPRSMAISADGEDVYVLGSKDKAVVRFDRNPGTGAIQFADARYEELGGIPAHVNARLSVVSPDGKHVYTTTDTFQGGVVILDRSAQDGRVAYLGRVTDSLATPRAMAVTPDGDHLLVGENSKLTVFRREPSTGLLEFVELHVNGVGGVQGLRDASSLSVSPDGASVYATSTISGIHGYLAVFSRDSATGSLTFEEAFEDGVGGVDGLSGAAAVTTDGNGSNVYVAGAVDNAVAVFSRDPATGLLSFLEVQLNTVGGVVGLKECGSIALSPDGSNLYATGPNSSSVVNFLRDSASGRLTYQGKKTNGFNGVVGLDQPRSIIVSPDGARVIAGSDFDDSLVVFARDPATGTLRFVEHHAEVLPDADNRIGPEHLSSSPDGRSIYVSGWRYDHSRLAVFLLGEAIADGVPVSNPGAIGWSSYRIEVPVCADLLRVEALDLNRNGELYTRSGALPSLSEFDCASTNPGTDPESCVHNFPTPGTWWIAVTSPPTGNPLRFTLSATIDGCEGEDLVSWWPAENDPMDVVGGNHGIPEGGLGYGPGMVGNAFTFDGLDDAIVVPHDPSLDVGSGDATISLWLKTDTDDDNVSLMDWRRIGPLRGLRVFLDEGRPAVHLGDGSAYAGLVADQTIADGRFHHIAISVQRHTTGGGRLLIDGRDTRTFDLAPVSGVLDSTEDFTMGRSSDATGGAAHFTGSLDEIRFHHRALPLREAVDGLGSLIGWWPADGSTFDRGGTNHGVGYPAYTQGRWAQAFKFIASSSPVTIPTDPALEIGAGDLAISCWVWSTTQTGEQTILDTRDAGGVGYRVFLDAGRPAIEIADGTQTAGVTSDLGIADGQLHHLVFSVDRDDGVGGSIFINGALDSTFDPTGAGGDLDTLEDLAIGRDTSASGGQSPFIGGIDDLQLHDASMTQTQVDWLHGSDGLLFLDGFENGNLSRWTVALP